MTCNCGNLMSTTPNSRRRYGSTHLTPTSSSTKNIVEVAQETPQLSTLVAALQAAGLVTTLSDANNFTVFAPSNKAFNNLPPGLLEALLLPANKDVLVDILLYHVLNYTLKNDTAGSYKTLNGNTLKKIVNGNTLSINTPSNVVTGKVKAGNSIIYLISDVLIPPDLDVSQLVQM